MQQVITRELLLVIALTLVLGCHTNVKVEPVEVKPITMTINVNIKVDRQLDEFFDFEQGLEPATSQEPEESAE